MRSADLEFVAVPSATVLIGCTISLHLGGLPNPKRVTLDPKPFSLRSEILGRETCQGTLPDASEVLGLGHLG